LFEKLQDKEKEIMETTAILEQTKEDAKSRTLKAIERIRKLNLRVAELEEKNNKTTNESIDAASEQTSLQLQLTDIRVKLQESEENNSELIVQYNKLQTHCDILDVELEKTRDVIVVYQEQQRKREQIEAEMEKRAKQSEETIAELRSSNGLLSEQVQDRESRIRQLSLELSSLHYQFEQAKEEIKRSQEVPDSFQVVSVVEFDGSVWCLIR
jgi:chromosome segregation ATPase